MLAGERHDHLLELLGREGEFVAKDVAVRLKISEGTVRRGLRDLAGEGLCRRVYGGALPVSSVVADYRTRQTVAPDGKRGVASGGRPTRTARRRRGPRRRRHGAGRCPRAPEGPGVHRDHPQSDDRRCAARPPEGRTLRDRRPAVQAFALAFSEKVGTASRCRVLSWGGISGLITDARPRIRRPSASWRRGRSPVSGLTARRGDGAGPAVTRPSHVWAPPATPARASRRAVLARPAPPLRFVTSWHSPGVASHRAARNDTFRGPGRAASGSGS